MLPLARAAAANNGRAVANNVAPHLQPVDKFFSASEARSDRWREMNAAANAWSSAKHDGAVPQQRALRLFDELSRGLKRFASLTWCSEQG